MIDLWLDDERPAPPNWVHVKTVDEAINVMQHFTVRDMSLDHDLGITPDGIEKTGYDFCLWMAEHANWPVNKPEVHSQNPVGRMAMKMLIDRHWRGKTAPPSDAPTRRMTDEELDALL